MKWTSASDARRRPRIGILDHESIRLGGSQHVVARIAACLSDRYHVEIIHDGRGYTVSELGAAFGLDLDGVDERVTKLASVRFSVPGPRSTLVQVATGFRREKELTRPYDLFIYSGHGAPPMCPTGRGVVYCHFPYDARPAIALEGSERWSGRTGFGRWLRLQIYERIWDRRMAGFPVLLANSRFSAEWIERLWGRRAEVVTPPVVGRAGGGEKRDLIASVGRFIATDRKNLRGQLRAFPEFLHRVGDGWTLCMIGFCSDLPEDRRFLAELRESARDLPVRFMVNARREEITDLLREAKLFWHTAGLPESGEVTAPRYQEHFGIATVEAMRAGCVPIVPDAGGQPEIVAHGESGYVCADLEELVELSASVATDPGLAGRIGRRAVRRSLDFSPDVFEDRVRAVVAHALAGAPAAPGVGRIRSEE